MIWYMVWYTMAVLYDGVVSWDMMYDMILI